MQIQQDFQTLFFKWAWMGSLWAAKDPTRKDCRWIIRQPSLITPSAKWEVGYIYTSQVFYRTFVGIDPSYLAWHAVGTRICQIAEISDHNPALMTEEEKMTFPEFFGFLEHKQ